MNGRLNYSILKAPAFFYQKGKKKKKKPNSKAFTELGAKMILKLVATNRKTLCDLSKNNILGFLYMTIKLLLA